MTPVGFEPTQLALVELESTPLDHSGKVSVAKRSRLKKKILQKSMSEKPLCLDGRGWQLMFGVFKMGFGVIFPNRLGTFWGYQLHHEKLYEPVWGHLVDPGEAARKAPQTHSQIEVPASSV